MTWGERVTALREKLGLTIDSFAELLGVTYQNIWGWERGGKVPNTSCMETLIGLLETHPEAGVRLLSERPQVLFGEETWSERIKRVRKTLGLTLVRFAALMGVSFGTVTRWEGGAGADSCSKVMLDLVEYSLEEAAPFLWPDLSWKSIEESELQWSPERIWLVFESLGLNREDLASLLRMKPEGVQHWFAERTAPGPCPSLLLWLLETYGPKAFFMIRDAKADEEWPSERVRAVRSSMGLTLAEMGALFRMSLGAYQMFERKGLPSGCWRALFWLLENRQAEMMELLQALPTVE